MKQVYYITISVKTLIDIDSREKMTNEVLKRADELKKMIPDSTIDDIEIANGYHTISIQKS